MRYLTLCCDRVSDREGLHAALRETLSLPDYYGNNLDALSDCLTDPMEPTCLTLRGLDVLRETLGDYADRLVRVFHTAALENPNLVVLIEHHPSEGKE